MKQILSLLVCVGLCIGMSSLLGCGGDEKKATTPAADAKKEKDKAK